MSNITSSVNMFILIIIVSFIFLFIIWQFKVKPYLKLRSFYTWLEENPRYKTMHEIEIFLLELYNNTDAYKTSREDSKRLQNSHDDFIYGEINFFSFLKILEITEPKSGAIFYDLGSGAGKAVLAAALYGDFSLVYGLELLPALDKIAHEKLKEANAILHVSANTTHKTWQDKINRIQFINKNFLDYNLLDADIVFINATCFGYQTWQSLIQKFVLLKSGSHVIVHTKKIEHQAFKLTHESRELTSFGDCTVRVYIRE